MKRKKLLFSILLIAVILLIAAAAAMFFRAAIHGQVQARELPDQPASEVVLGELFTLKIICNLPWGQELAQTSFKPQDGIVQSGNLQIKTLKFSLRGRQKLVTVPLKSYRTGKLEAGSLALQIQRPWAKNMTHQTVLEVKAAPITIIPHPVKDKNSLPLADELTYQKPHNSFSMRLIAVIAAVLALLGCLIYRLIRYRKNRLAAPVPPWVTAQQSIAELRDTANSGKQPLAWCVSRLTDVVRNYLSERFALPANQQTTSEFFASLKSRKSPLTSAQTAYLEEFMNSADLVKFANIRPDRDNFAYAVNRAEDLVRETSQTEEPSSGNNSVDKKESAK